MLIASTSLVVIFVVTVCLRHGKQRPLDQKDINRVRLFSDRVHREDVYPHG